MKKTLWGMMVAALLLAASSGFAQNPNFNNGPIWKVTYTRIIPGQDKAFWDDLHEHGKPILDEAKKEGVILDYKMMVNTYKDRPEDWDLMMAIEYPNYAALDGLEAKAAAVYQKHFVTKEKEDESVKKRVEHREIIAIRLLQEVTFK